jgi:hypothetical protein
MGSVDAGRVQQSHRKIGLLIPLGMTVSAGSERSKRCRSERTKAASRGVFSTALSVCRCVYSCCVYEEGAFVLYRGASGFSRKIIKLHAIYLETFRMEISISYFFQCFGVVDIASWRLLLFFRAARIQKREPPQSGSGSRVRIAPMKPVPPGAALLFLL